jgi:hypothetical protein
MPGYQQTLRNAAEAPLPAGSDAEHTVTIVNRIWNSLVDPATNKILDFSELG